MLKTLCYYMLSVMLVFPALGSMPCCASSSTMAGQSMSMEMAGNGAVMNMTVCFKSQPTKQSQSYPFQKTNTCQLQTFTAIIAPQMTTLMPVVGTWASLDLLPAAITDNFPFGLSGKLSTWAQGASPPELQHHSLLTQHCLLIV